MAYDRKENKNVKDKTINESNLISQNLLNPPPI